MSVEPGVGGSIVVPGSATTTTLSLDVQTGIAQPGKRLMFAVYKTDVELTVVKHLNRVKAIDWKTPVGLLATIVLTLATSHFHDFARVPAALWAGCYAVAGALCFWNVLVVGYKAWKDPPMTVDELVEKIVNPDAPYTKQ